jgi:toxin ParE1/3/4
MRLIWDARAGADLQRIWRHIARDNIPAASKVFSRVRTGVEALTAVPMLGRAGRLAGTREFVFVDIPYIAIYRIDGIRDTVEVLRVVHSAQKWPPDE